MKGNSTGPSSYIPQAHDPSLHTESAGEYKWIPASRGRQMPWVFWGSSGRIGQMGDLWFAHFIGSQGWWWLQVIQLEEKGELPGTGVNLDLWPCYDVVNLWVVF